MDCCLPGSSVRGILQARILAWVALPSSGDLFNPGIDPLTSPTLTGGFFTTHTTWEAPSPHSPLVPNMVSTPKGNHIPCRESLPISPSTRPWQPLICICLFGFIYSGCFISMEAYNPCPFPSFAPWLVDLRGKPRDRRNGKRKQKNLLAKQARTQT